MQDKRKTPLSIGDSVRYTGQSIEERGISTGDTGTVKGERSPFHVRIEFRDITENIPQSDIEKI